MFRDKKILLVVGLLLAAPAIFIGCSDNKQAKDQGFVHKVIDSVTESVAQNLEKARVQPADSVLTDTAGVDTTVNAMNLAVTIEDSDAAIPAIHDMVVTGKVVHAVFDGGMLIYDLKTDEYSVTSTDGPLRAITDYAGTLYAGGDMLYEVDGQNLIPVEVNLQGQINTLFDYGTGLMIGTTKGLYVRNLLGTTLVLDDKNITAMAETRGDLWIGTDGDGLYCFDGEQYRQRYLSRDPSLFDHVTALEAGHNHLYLGTKEAMYVYDGGSWQTYGVDQGLPSGYVTSIDASDWVVYVGTTNGAASLFEGKVSPVKRLDSQVITSIRKAGYRILAGTGQNGLVVKSGPAVRTITEPWEKTNDLASIAF